MRQGEKSIISGESSKALNRAHEKTPLKNLFGILEFRFDDSAVQVLRPALESIKDLQSLEELHREALRAESFEAFTRVLSMNGQ